MGRPPAEPRGGGARRRRVLASLVRHRDRVLVLWLALAAGSLPGLFTLSSDNAPWLFFARGDPALEAHLRLTATFGDFDAVRVAAVGPGLWTAEGLDWLRDLERGGQGLAGAWAGSGLFRRYRRPLGTWPPPDPEAFRRRAAADPLSRNLGWASADGRAASALIAVRGQGSAERRRFFDGLAELRAAAPPGVESRVAGIPVLSRALDLEIARFGLRLFPLLSALAAALLALLLRSVTQAVPCLALAAVNEILLFGAMGYAAVPITLVTALLPPIVLVLSVATGIHLQLRVRAFCQRGLADDDAVVAGLEDKLWPVVATGVTTLVGFGSAVVSPVPAVRSFGLWAAAAVALVTAAALTLLPALLAALGGRRGAARPVAFERRMLDLGRRTGALAARRRGAILVAFALSLAAAAAGWSRLAAETDLLGYFHADHPVREDLRRLDELGLAPATADLLLELPADGPGQPGLRFDGAAGAARLARLAGELRADPAVLGALGAGEIEALPEGDADAGLRRVARALLLSEDGRRARVALAIPMLGYRETAALAERAEARARQLFPAAAATLTGSYPLVSSAQRTALKTLLAALALTLACVAAVFAALVRDLRRTVRVLVPNLWPVAVMLGAMGWLGIPLGANTVMMGAIILGLAVDDTLHFFGDYRRLGRVDETLEGTAGAHVLSSATLGVGFGTCALSGFVPLVQAGAVLTLGVAAALAADLLLLPALLADRR